MCLHVYKTSPYRQCPGVGRVELFPKALFEEVLTAKNLYHCTVVFLVDYQ